MKIVYKNRRGGYLSKNKFLNIKNPKSNKRLIAEYKFDNTVYDLIPEFDDGFTYTYEDIHETITPTMEAGSIDWTNGVNYDDALYPDSNRSDFLSIKPSTGYYHTGREYTINYYWYDSNKQFIKAEEYDYNTVVISPENSSFLRVGRGDWTGDLCIHENITTRTIYSNNLPTLITFGDYSGNNDKTNSLLEVNYLNTSNVTNMIYMFTYCNNLTTLDANNWDTSNVINMAYMFYACESLTELNVSSWDTSKVTDMEGMFGYYDNGDEIMALTSITGLENWNTSNVTNMQSMFANCRNLTTLDISNFDTSNVTNMTYMFYNCRNLTELDVSNFNTSNVTDMICMFENCYNLTTLDVSNFNTSNVTNMYGMFYGCESLTGLNVSGWDTSKVEDMKWMFGFYDNGDETMALTSIIGLENWDTSNVTNMEGMFCHCRNLTTLDVSNFDTSNVVNMNYMFRDCNSLTQLNLSSWDMSLVEDTTEMFNIAKKLGYIIMNNSDYNSINKVITELPSRTADSIGTLNIAGIDDISQIDINTLNSKYWTVTSHTILNNARLGQTKLN